MPGDERRIDYELLLAKAVADESSDGIVLCDTRGRIIHVNAPAAALLSVAHKAEVERISLSAVTIGEQQQANVNGFVVTARPLRIDEGDSIAIATIRLHAQPPTEESIRGKFGLSRREAQVAVLLADRRTDAEIAAALGISWHTVRSHVERIFTALGCHTRRDAAAKLKAPN